MHRIAAELEHPADATTKPLSTNLSDIRDDPWFWTRARPLAIAALLDKPERHEIQIDAKYIGFTIPNHFVVGYGLDVGEMYRNLPFIAIPEDPERLVGK